jgi:acetyl esterase/lipase
MKVNKQFLGTFLLGLFLLSIFSMNLSAQSLPEGIQSLIDQPYVPNAHKHQRLDLFWFKDKKVRPVLVWIHGGAFRGGDKKGTIFLPFLELGYVVVSINYRLSPDAPFPAQVEDCKAAIRWLRANARKYYIDPDRIGVWGSSAGGHLAAFLGTSGDVKEFDKGPNLKYSSRVQAVIDIFGPVDFIKLRAESDTKESPEYMLFRCLIKECPDKAIKASPLTYISKDDPPFLIIHGDKDEVIPYNQSVLFNEALNRAGIDTTYILVKGKGHSHKDIWDMEQERIKSFFDKHLKGKRIVNR